MSWWLLVILYGLVGFGYIIVVIYLLFMVKDVGLLLLIVYFWMLVGLLIVFGCFGWLWVVKCWGALPCLMVNLLVQVICVLFTFVSDLSFLLIISSFGFGGIFMGMTFLVMIIVC